MCSDAAKQLLATGTAHNYQTGMDESGYEFTAFQKMLCSLENNVEAQPYQTLFKC
jgi:hypothetical protein